MMTDKWKWTKRIIAGFMIFSSWACAWFMIAVTLAYLLWMPDATITMESWRFGFGLSVFLLVWSLIIIKEWMPRAGSTKAQKVESGTNIDK